jgi:PAS domain S-box
MDYEDKSKEQIIAELIALRESHQKEIIKCRQTEDELINVINLSSDAFILVGVEGKIKHINLMFCKTILGCNPKELVGRSCIEFINSFVHPDDLDETIKVAQNAIKGEYNNCENRYLCIDGSIKWYKWTHTLLVNTESYFVIGHDITQQKIAEEELKKSNDQISNILESIRDAFFALDSQWKFIYFNKDAERIYKRKSQEVIGKIIWDEFPSYIGTDYQKNFFKVMKDRVVIQTESKGIYSNEWVEVHIYPTNDGISVYYRDISERKRMEIALHQSEERYRILFTNTNDSIFVYGLTSHNLPGKFIEINDVACKSLGYKRDELLNLSPNDIKYTEELSELANIINKLITERHLLYESIKIAKDGRKIPVEVHANLFDLNGEPTILAIARDITERKKAVEVLITEQKRLFSLLDGLPGIVYLRDSDYNICFSNQRFWNLFGKPKNSHCFELIHNRKEPCKECPSDRVLNTNTPQTWENSFTNDKMFEIYTYPFQDINGSPQVLNLLIDITERKQFEKEMARLSRLNLIGEMAAGIAHEVRNPMTTVRGFLQLLGNKKEYVQYKEYHELMIEELDRANSIITEFLSLAKDKVDYLEVRSLNSIIEIMYPLINAEARNCGKDVRIDFGNIPELLLNEKEIRQLLLNLIQNGLESMDTGGCLDIRTFVEDGEVVLMVKDQGNGIPHELLEKIGTPFFTTKANGTGLGLATCYSITKRHNARIDVETGAEGTTFYVRFKILHNF